MKSNKDQGDSLLLQLGAQLQAVRKERNLTQRDVYQQTGIHAARIERGKVNLSFTTLLTLCQTLGVKMWEVLKVLDV